MRRRISVSRACLSLSLSSPSGRVALAQAFGDFQLPSGVDGDGPLALEYVNSVRDEPGVQSTGGRMLDEVGCVKVRIEVTQRGVRAPARSAGDSKGPNSRAAGCCAELIIAEAESPESRRGEAPAAA